MQLIALSSTSNETKNPSKTPLKQNTQNNLHNPYFYQNKEESVVQDHSKNHPYDYPQGICNLVYCDDDCDDNGPIIG